MKVEYINPFVESTIYVLKEMLGLKSEQLKRGQLSLKINPIGVYGVASVIGLTGDLRGRVVLDMAKNTAVEVAEIMNNEKFPGMNNLVRSTINELANIISGRAVSILGQNGCKADVTPPSLFSGSDIEIDDSSGMQTLVIPIETPYG